MVYYSVDGSLASSMHSALHLGGGVQSLVGEQWDHDPQCNGLSVIPYTSVPEPMGQSTVVMTPGEVLSGTSPLPF